jgi:hypothetical protein
MTQENCSYTTSVTLREVAGSRIQPLRREIIPVRVCFLDHIHFPSYQALARDCHSLCEEFRFISRGNPNSLFVTLG